jgi:hypothetical protein
MHVMPYAIPVIASCALKHLMHYVILILSLLSNRPRIHGAGIGSLSEASSI